MRVAFLTNIVSPYRRGVFERLAATPGWDLRVIVNAEREFDRDWHVDTDALPLEVTRTLTRRRRVVTHEPVRFEQTIELHVPVGLPASLRRARPDVVISHELGPRSAIAAAWCAMTRTPFCVWAYQSRVSGSLGGRARSLLRRRILAAADPVIGMGTQAREVLANWGVADERIVDAPNAADHVTIARTLADPATADRVDRIRARVGGRRIALVVGRLVPLKGTPEILAAWRALPREARDGWCLAFVGDGPFRALVDDAIERNAADGFDDVVRVGSTDAVETTAWYAASDLHVFPTLGDVWGLVVNEASHCGVPSLCSIHAGCADDLIADGRDGLLFDPTDPVRARDGLARALARPDLAELGRRARARAASFTLDRLADAFRTAARRAAGRPGAGDASRATADSSNAARVDQRVVDADVEDPTANPAITRPRRPDAA